MNHDFYSDDYIRGILMTQKAFALVGECQSGAAKLLCAQIPTRERIPRHSG